MSDLILLFILEIISIILSFLYIICSFFCYPHYTIDDDIIKYYNNNWNSGMITDIIISPLNAEERINKCLDPGYEPFISYEYPGLYEGCNCLISDSISYKDKVYNSTCSEKKIKENCEQVKEMPSQKLIWKNSNLCIKRNKNLNYFEIASNTLKGKGEYILRKNCLLNEISCGEIDSLGNVLCVEEKNKEKCPFNYIDFNENLEGKVVTDEDNIQMLYLNDNEREENRSPLYYGTLYGSLVSNKRINNNKILNEFLVNSHPICAKQNEGIFGQNDFNLNKLKGEEFCQKGDFSDIYDERYKLIDTEDGEDFYNRNYLSSVLNQISGYKYDSESDVRLYSINYFGIKQECLGHEEREGNLNLNFELINLTKPDLGTNRKIILSLAIISFLYFLFLLVQINFIFKYGRKLLWTEITKIGFVLLVVVLSSCSIHYFRKNLNTYNLLMDNKCFDNFSNVSFKLGYQSINSCLKYLAITLSFSIADFILKIVMLVIFLIKKKDEKIN